METPEERRQKTLKYNREHYLKNKEYFSKKSKDRVKRLTSDRPVLIYYPDLDMLSITRSPAYHKDQVTYRYGANNRQLFVCAYKNVEDTRIVKALLHKEGIAKDSKNKQKAYLKLAKPRHKKKVLDVISSLRKD